MNRFKQTIVSAAASALVTAIVGCGGWVGSDPSMDGMGWDEDAKAALEACDRQIAESITILGRENAADNAPTSWVVNDRTN